MALQSDEYQLGMYETSFKKMWLAVIFQPIIAFGGAKDVPPNNYQIPLNQTSSVVMTSLPVWPWKQSIGNWETINLQHPFSGANCQLHRS